MMYQEISFYTAKHFMKSKQHVELLSKIHTIYGKGWLLDVRDKRGCRIFLTINWARYRWCTSESYRNSLWVCLPAVGQTEPMDRHHLGALHGDTKASRY